jgi:hypothetical protein
MKNLVFLLFLSTGAGLPLTAQKLASFEVDMTNRSIFSEPIQIGVDAITLLPDSVLTFTEVRGNKSIAVPFQIDQGQQRSLNWMVAYEPKGPAKRIFELIKTTSRSTSTNSVSFTRQDGALIIKSNDKNLLQYNFKTVYPPAGVDSSYKRSGFIHPLWSPHGQVLTRIQPPDHYHHYGIWNPWTHLLYKNDTLDLWNLNGKKGTVRFANFTSIKGGDVFAEYSALHEHVAFRKTGDEVMLNEIQTVRIYRPENDDYYIADITIQLNCASETPVLLLKYRYGGLGWRTTEQWTKDNSEVLTSAGKNRKEADGTKAAWCLVQGAVDNDYAGVLMMSYPTNYNHPEPLRIWPENQYNRGDMFANFDPTKDRDWLLEPGKNYVLKYRFLIFNNHFTKEKSDNAWQSFANPPKVTSKIY